MVRGFEVRVFSKMFDVEFSHLKCRYDLLCLEGLVQSLRIFCGIDSVPNYKLSGIGKESMLKMHVKPEVYIS